MRVASIGHAIFAVTMIGLGIIGLLHRDFVPVWNPVPSVSAGGLLLSLGALISLSTGIGLLIRHVAGASARLLLATFLVWLLLFRLPNFFLVPAFAACWSVFPLAVMLAAAWVLYVWFATDWDRNHLGFVIGGNGLFIARTLYGLSLIFFGAAHFIDVKDTLSLIPNWLPGHLFWAYFTGCAFIAAGVAGVTGLCARLAVAPLGPAACVVPGSGLVTHCGGWLEGSLPVERDHPECCSVGCWMGRRRFLPLHEVVGLQQPEQRGCDSNIFGSANCMKRFDCADVPTVYACGVGTRSN